MDDAAAGFQDDRKQKGLEEEKARDEGFFLFVQHEEAIAEIRIKRSPKPNPESAAPGKEGIDQQQSDPGERGDFKGAEHWAFLFIHQSIEPSD